MLPTALRRPLGLLRQILGQTLDRSSSINGSCTVLTSPSLQILRHKSKKPQSQVTTSETEMEQSSFDNEVTDKHSKIMTLSVKSLRIDGILKSALGIARNKIETLFYESKIRVNGQKLLKKSDLAKEGDEIDIVKGASTTNPDFLLVSRVEVLGVTEKGENIGLKVRRCKSLTIENYDTNAKPGQ